MLSLFFLYLGDRNDDAKEVWVVKDDGRQTGDTLLAREKPREVLVIGNVHKLRRVYANQHVPFDRKGIS